jgi:hypothetical protein
MPGIAVEELAVDFGAEGAIDYATGRRFALVTPAVFPMGSPGPIEVDADATRPGEGHNNPEPGSIRRIVQVGAGFANDGASLTPGTTQHRLVVRPEPDVIVAEHVGQHIEFVDGSNAGRVARVVGYEGPVIDATAPTGGTALLAACGIYRCSVVLGTFEVGEIVEQSSSGARTRVPYLLPSPYVALERVEGELDLAGSPLLGTRSGAGAVLESIEESPDLIAEAGTASWRVLDWAGDLGVVVTHDARPAGGRDAWLDEIGDERGVRRGSGEEDDAYRPRVGALGDAISPRAILRIANRILAPYGHSAVLREVGYPSLRGLFYDGDPSNTDPAVAFAYDLDPDARPDDRFKVALDYTDFRAFFLIGVPPLGLGEFGAAYDIGSSNAYDAAPYLAFYDGFPLTAAAIYRAIWQEIYRARGGGVGFDLYLERPAGPPVL